MLTPSISSDWIMNMICSAKPDSYHFLTFPTFEVKIFDCQCQTVANISGRLSLDGIEDIKTISGEQAAKDAWWQTYLWIREQEHLQYKAKGLE